MSTNKQYPLLVTLLEAFGSGLLAALVLACLTLLLAGQASADDRSDGSGSMDVRTASGRVIRDVPRLKTDVQMHISGMLARVTVKQRFVNPSSEWVEAVYRFPLPPDSAVDHLRMVSGDRVIEGMIKEKGQARRAYRQARAQGKQASLIEQERPNIFTTSLANIPPRGQVTVQIQYQQAVQLSDGVFSLRFPMVVGPRYIPGSRPRARPVDAGQDSAFDAHGWATPSTSQVADAQAISSPIADALIEQSYRNPVSLSIDLDAGLPLADVRSLYQPIDKRSLGSGRMHIGLAHRSTPADRDFVLQWRLQPQAMPDAALFTQHWKDANYGMLMLVPPTPDKAPVPPRELILVVDTSGSMYGTSIRQARAALQLALRQLRPQDRFNIIRFSDNLDQLFPNTVPATPDNLNRARAFVAGLQAQGGTEMLPAMRRALQTPVHPGWLRQVVFLTDGDIGNEQALFQEIHQDLGQARLFPVGIGSAPNSYFMTRAAAYGRGTFTYIGDRSEVGERMHALFARLSAPMLSDIKVRWDSDGTVTQAPEKIPDLYAGKPLVLSVRSTGALRGVTVTGRIGRKNWHRHLQLGGGANAPGVHVLWARRMITDALARRSLGDDAGQVRQQVLDLALSHHLVSPYTSLVAVDQTPIRPGEAQLHKTPVPILLPHGWDQAHVVGMPQTATPARLYQLLGALLLILVLLLERHAGRRPPRLSRP